MRSRAMLCASMMLLALTGCSDRSDDPVVVEETRTPETSCGTHSPLDIVDHGWSALPGDDDLVQISFGAVVENTSASTTVGYGGTVEVTFLDESGRQLGYGDGSEPETAQIFTFKELHPAAVVAVSGMALMSQPPAEVAFDATGACTQDPETVARGAITVHSAEVTVEGDELSASMKIESTYEEPTNGLVVLLFRDGDGDIVGGGPYQGMSGNGAEIGPVSPGSSTAEVTVDIAGFLPDDADLDETDLYIVRR